MTGPATEAGLFDTVALSFSIRRKVPGGLSSVLYCLLVPCLVPGRLPVLYFKKEQRASLSLDVAARIRLLILMKVRKPKHANKIDRSADKSVEPGFTPSYAAHAMFPLLRLDGTGESQRLHFFG
jgi:hypothetical protein